MSDKEILDRIHSLVDEEHKLRQAHAGEGLVGEDRERLTALERSLDQAWDLLRQRRAKAEYGNDPSSADDRPEGEVEGYLQ